MEPKWIWNAKARKGFKIWIANLQESWLVKVNNVRNRVFKVAAWAEVEEGADGTSQWLNSL